LKFNNSYQSLEDKQLQKIKLADPMIYCIAIFSVYSPGWYGPFVFDDQLNILENQNVPKEDQGVSQLDSTL